LGVGTSVWENQLQAWSRNFSVGKPAPVLESKPQCWKANSSTGVETPVLGTPTITANGDDNLVYADFPCGSLKNVCASSHASIACAPSATERAGTSPRCRS